MALFCGGIFHGGIEYNHGGEILALFLDALGPPNMEHRHLLSGVVELLDLLDPSEESFLHGGFIISIG
jgi:hypothetical protein